MFFKETRFLSFVHACSTFSLWCFVDVNKALNPFNNYGKVSNKHLYKINVLVEVYLIDIHPSIYQYYFNAGSPKPDPHYPIQNKTTPRLGDVVEFTVHCVGNPVPSFTWLHNGKHLRSTDNNITCGSTLTVDKIVADDFGAYLLEMENHYGEFNVSFDMIPEGK